MFGQCLTESRAGSLVSRELIVARAYHVGDRDEGGEMGVDAWDLVVGVTPTDSGDDEVPVLVGRLRQELLELDIDAADAVSTGSVPLGTKSVSAVAGTVGVRLGSAGLKAVVAKIRDWVARSGRSVEVTIDGDTVKLTSATGRQQEQLINVWLARHAPSS